MTPLVRSPRVRRLTAVGLVVGAVLAAVLAWFSLTMLFAPLVFAGTMAFALAAPLTGRTIAAGRRAPEVDVVVDLVATAVVVALLALLLVAGAWDALDTWRTRSAWGTPTHDVTRALTPVVVAALVLAVLAATLPLPAPRRVAVGAVVLLLAIAGTATGAGALAARVDPRGCQDFRLDRERWQRALATPDDDGEYAPSERLAAAVVRCGTVAGATREEVRAALGDPTHVGARGWTWAVGLTNDGIGPGDAQELSVRFGPDGRARAVELAYE